MLHNRTSTGYSFSSQTVEAVWQKGQIVAGYNPNVYRKDTCGAWMQKSQYGNTNSEYGWEIDHIIPVSKNGSDHISNLQPLQWQNNRYKSDKYPNWSCAVGTN